MIFISQKTIIVLIFIITCFVLWFIVNDSIKYFFYNESKPYSIEPFSVKEWEILRTLIRDVEIPYDASNQYLHNNNVIDFGEKLFFSTQLSSNNQLSCASCHKPDNDWTDNLSVAIGLSKGTKNTPSLWNTSFNRWYFWDGRADSAWAQALGPLENPSEMGDSRLSIVKKISTNSELYTEYTQLFGNDLQQYKNGIFPDFGSPLLPNDDKNKWEILSCQQKILINRIFVNIGKSLAAFETTIISVPSSLDKFIQFPDKYSLTKQEISGLKLFIGKAGCIRCHMGPEFTNNEFHNIRLLTHEGGRYEGIRQLLDSEFTQLSLYSDNRKNAKIQYLKQVKRNWGEFKVPGLRRVKFTPPYMHDGRFKTLEDVIEYYSELVGAINDGHLSETLIVPLNLTQSEKNNLAAFLKII